MLDFQARAPKRISQTYHHAKYSSAVYLVRLARCVFVYLELCRVRTGEVPLVDDSPSLSLVNSWPHCNLWTNCFFFIGFFFCKHFMPALFLNSWGIELIVTPDSN